jgi:endonuclease-3 related protein
MLTHYGPTHWWPGETPFEIAVGAILTQNTNWTNVERALENLKALEMLRPEAIIAAEDDTLEAALRPSGYFRQKAKRVRNFSRHLMEHYGGDMALMARRPLEELRRELLHLHGIGPETADDIILYACELPVFVVDTYTRRILHRHGLVPHDIAYEPLRAVFESRLPRDVAMWKEYHGLMVYIGKDFCRPTPRCEECPLRPLLPGGAPA